MISVLYRLADRLRHRARRRRAHPDLAAGRRGEDLAHRFLRRQGYTVIARNFRPRNGAGEIDLVAWEGDHLAFVEVKSRASDEFGTPDRAVDPEKQKHLVRAAGEYARRAGVDWGRVRFDIVGILLTEPPQIDLVRDAFGPQRTYNNVSQPRCCI
ncbi:MAG TPA: YraN family protein [Bryobacteraceae bacterium]|nr:YraN family protein [Bryobacteraceae bacterium]